MKNIAIIGAGISGLALAHKLKNHANVTVFEKSRGVGGRMATRYADPYRFDHGAQFFYVKTQAFQSFIAPLIDAGAVERWDGRFFEFEGNKVASKRSWNASNPHYVGSPGMNAVGQYLARDLDVRLNTPVASLMHKVQWHLIGKDGEELGAFDWVISTAPAQQSAQLMPPNFAHYKAIQNIKMMGCFSLMFGFEQPKDFGFDVGLVREADISWVSVNNTKPGRDAATTLLVHSTNKWAEAHLDGDREEALDYLMAETSKVIGVDVSDAAHKKLHGWRYANIERQEGAGAFVDVHQGLAACGDWCIQGRVESAFTSAIHVADEMLPHLVSGAA